MVQKELTASNQVYGVANWLACGLKIQETQCVNFLFVCLVPNQNPIFELMSHAIPPSIGFCIGSLSGPMISVPLLPSVIHRQLFHWQIIPIMLLQTRGSREYE